MVTNLSETRLGISQKLRRINGTKLKITCPSPLYIVHVWEFPIGQRDWKVIMKKNLKVWKTSKISFLHQSPAWFC